MDLRGWGQKNPLIEYKRESFAIFEDMMRLLRREIVHHVFHMNLERFNQAELEQRRERELDQLNMIGTELPGENKTEQQAQGPKVGRNDDCPCGSGKKFKKCHGK